MDRWSVALQFRRLDLTFACVTILARHDDLGCWHRPTSRRQQDLLPGNGVGSAAVRSTFALQRGVPPFAACLVGGLLFLPCPSGRSRSMVPAQLAALLHLRHGCADLEHRRGSIGLLKDII